jgi:pSer/pThr/pTyr-binding forkhead associated (FHA) protein
MQVCPHCGRESRATDRYCLHCGQRLDGQPGDGADALDAMAVYVAVPGGSGGTWSTSQPDAGVVGSSRSGQPAGAPAGAPSGVPGADPRPKVIARLILQPREGDEVPREYPLDGRDVTIGRAPGCDIILPNDQLASRRHSILRYDIDHYTIADLGSSNGTYVNGAEIRDVTPLAEGDRVTVGEHELLYTRAGVRTTDGFPIPVPPPWPPASISPTGQHAVVRPGDAPPPARDAPAAAAPGSAPAGTPPLAAPAAPAPSISASLAEIEQLRAQLVDASSGLARRVEETERQLSDTRAALGELERLAAEALSGVAAALASDTDERTGESAEGSETAGAAGQAEATPYAEMDQLLLVLRQAADNPRHLDYVTALVGRAGNLIRVIESQRAVVAALEDVRSRLAALAGDAEPAES